MPDAERYPLYWPEGQPRTKSRKATHAFRVDFVQARDDLMRELELLGARGVVISTNVPIRSDGLPRADMGEPTDPGVAVYFDRKVGQDDAGRPILRPYVVACDTFSRVRYNLRAVGCTIEAMRAIARYGASSMLEQAFSGFAALPPARAARPWWEVLGLAPSATPDDVRRAVRELAGRHHPDRGGDEGRMVEINRAAAEALSR